MGVGLEGALGVELDGDMNDDLDWDFFGDFCRKIVLVDCENIASLIVTPRP